MTNQIEMTLQDAVERCKKEGGRFWFRDHVDPFKYRYVQESGRVTDENGKRFELEWKDFERVWIYEPPQKSAFQEWSDKNPGHVWKEFSSKDSYYCGQKEAWSGAIDAVIKVLKDDGYVKAAAESGTINLVEKLR